MVLDVGLKKRLEKVVGEAAQRQDRVSDVPFCYSLYWLVRFVDGCDTLISNTRLESIWNVLLLGLSLLVFSLEQ